MDIVDLDKVLDDLEEDEERISVCVVEKEVSANGFVNGPGAPSSATHTYSISISDKYSDIPYPQQVSNEPPTPDSPLYNNVYGVPYKLTENIKLSDADFGFSPSLPGLKENSLDNKKDDGSSEADFSPDIENVGQLLQNNGVLEIRDLPCNTTLNSTLSGYANNSVLPNISSLGSSISTDSDSFSNLPSKDFDSVSPAISGQHSASEHLSVRDDKHLDSYNNEYLNSASNNSSGFVQSNNVERIVGSTRTLKAENGFINSDAIGIMEKTYTSGLEAVNEIRNQTPSNQQMDIVGFDAAAVNVTDEDMMAYLNDEGNSATDDNKHQDEQFRLSAGSNNIHLNPDKGLSAESGESSVSYMDSQNINVSKNLEEQLQSLDPTHEQSAVEASDTVLTNDDSGFPYHSTLAKEQEMVGNDSSLAVGSHVPAATCDMSLMSNLNQQGSVYSNVLASEISEGNPSSQESHLQITAEQDNSVNGPRNSDLSSEQLHNLQNGNEEAFNPDERTKHLEQDLVSVRESTKEDIANAVSSCSISAVPDGQSNIGQSEASLPASTFDSNPSPGIHVPAQMANPSQATCPGVKPKETNKMKRPSSLLGLSTVSLPMGNSGVPKSQSLPRSFAMGMKASESPQSESVGNKSTLDSVPRNECQGYQSGDSLSPPDKLPGQPVDGCTPALLNMHHQANLVNEPMDANTNPPVTDLLGGDLNFPTSEAIDSQSALAAQTQRLAPGAVMNGDGSTNVVDPSMLPPSSSPSVVIAYGQPPQPEMSHLPRDVRPESLNLPPFLGFPSHLPDGGVEPEGMGPPGLYRQGSNTSDPPAYQDLSDSSSEVGGAVGGAPAIIGNVAPGSVAPVWVPDAEAPNCMACESRFTFTKRRHHCRACGKVFCSSCCSLKCKLDYMGSKEARVCVACHDAILTGSPSARSERSPNPNNPAEYCSTIPPHQQVTAPSPAPTVLVPVGVLKREGSHRRGEPKQVMFSDGIRPGGDLTEIDGVTEARLPQRSGRKVHKVERSPPADGQGAASRTRLKVTESSRLTSLIPAVGLPPLMDEQGFPVDDNPTDEKVIEQIQKEGSGPVVFMINPNLQCKLAIVNLDCCVHRRCWCFSSRGLCTVGQQEVVVVLECLPDEAAIPMDVFHHLQALYTAASKGSTVGELDHWIFTEPFLGSKEHGGLLYIRPTFQCLMKLTLPSPPYLVAILLQKWEIPWAKVFPIRLLLRLGAEYRYYPCPLISIRNRKPVFFEIGHTIMNLLADFRGYQYMLAQVKGLHIHMEDQKTLINFPRNRYQELMKVVTSSNEHVMALGANFSMEADSHLVCIQNDEGNYQTQAINIQNKPRKVTGASFVVFNGALKSASGLTAKSSIVEDGLMVQIFPDAMVALKQAIKDMKNYSISCGSVGSTKPDEVITVQWVEDDKSINIGVKSPIDNMAMDGIESIHIHNGTDYQGENQVIRWTEVFFIQTKDSAKLEPIDLSRLAESLAQAGCIALTPHLDTLKSAQLTKIGLRATIHAESVGYEVGGNGEKLPDMYMNDLDNELIPVIHNAASLNQEGPITLELIFYILN